MKKLISVLLLLTMVVGLFAGCGNSGGSATYKDDAGEDVTLVMALPWAEQKDATKVVEEVNKKLEKLLPNTTLEIMFESNMEEKWPLWMSTKKQIDIAHSGFVTDIENEVSKKSYLELDGLVEEYGENIKTWQEKYWMSFDSCKVEGKLYAIPNTQYYTKDTVELRIFNEAADIIDLKALTAEAWKSNKTSAKFWDILYSETLKAEKAGADCKSGCSLTLYEIAQRGYTFIGGENSNFCYDNTDNSGKIINFYETKEFEVFCDFMAKAAKNGWVSKDILTGQWTDHFHGGTTTRYGADENGIRRGEKDVTLVLDNPENDVIVNKIGYNSTHYSIPFTSQNPARAMKLLDLMNSAEGVEIVNLLAFGFEGTHYDITDKENDDIVAREYQGQGNASVSYGVPMWMLNNMMVDGLYNVAPHDHKEKEYAIDYYENHVPSCDKHVLYGIYFDYTPIRADLNKIIKNNGEYAESIYCGIVTESDKLLKELTEKNKSAGYEKVRAELQKQVDEFLASK